MPKTIAFCLFKYFPHGGLQRDFLRIALKCRHWGISIRVYTMSWDGDIPDGFDIQMIPARGFGNHSQARMFAVQVQKQLLKNPAELVVGFNKMPGLDVYFASDVCFAQRVVHRNRLFRLTGRCRTYMEMERAVFSPESSTHILLLSNKQVEEFQQHYGLRTGCYTLMPPGLDENFRIPDNLSENRSRLCREFGLNENAFILLHVGSAFKGKGVDRAIRALAALPNSIRSRCFLLIAGNGKPPGYQRLARKSGVGNLIHFAGVRQDVPALMAAADILVHPARVESAGMTLLESLAASLPTICTSVCGYASYIAESSGGIVLQEPFRQQDLNAALETMLNRPLLDQHRKSIKNYCNHTPLCGLHEKAAEVIIGFMS